MKGLSIISLIVIQRTLISKLTEAQNKRAEIQRVNTQSEELTQLSKEIYQLQFALDDVDSYVDDNVNKDEYNAAKSALRMMTHSQYGAFTQQNNEMTNAQMYCYFKTNLHENAASKVIFDLTGKHNIQCPTITSQHIKKGVSFYFYDLEEERVDKLTVTFVRNDMFFYKKETSEEEYSAPIKCLFTKKLEPEYIATDMSEKYYTLSLKYNMSKIIYDYGINDNLSTSIISICEQN